MLQQLDYRRYKSQLPESMIVFPAVGAGQLWRLAGDQHLLANQA